MTPGEGDRQRPDQGRFQIDSSVPEGSSPPWPAPEWFDDLDSTNAELIRRLGSESVSAESVSEDVAATSSSSVTSGVSVTPGFVVPGAGPVPGTTVVARQQRQGRGRQGRSWLGSQGESLLFSVALPLRGITPERMGWLPLLVGVACVEGMRAWLSERADLGTSSPASGSAEGPPAATSRANASASTSPRLALKWPNDVVVLGGRHEAMGKCAGILLEALSDWAVAGVGVNVSQPAEVLDAIPVTGLPATSLAAEWAGMRDGDGALPVVLEAIREALHRWWHAWESAGFDPRASGLRAAYLDECATLGAEVDAHLPGGGLISGRVEGLSDQGWLLVRESPGQPLSMVSAGDVMHVRHR